MLYEENKHYQLTDKLFSTNMSNCDKLCLELLCAQNWILWVFEKSKEKAISVFTELT